MNTSTYVLLCIKTCDVIVPSSPRSVIHSAGTGTSTTTGQRSFSHTHFEGWVEISVGD